MISIQNIFETSAVHPKKPLISTLSMSSSSATTTADTVRVDANMTDETTQHATLTMQSAQRKAGCEIKLLASVKRNKV